MKTLLVLSSLLLAALPAAAETKHTVVPKDCLWNLAQHYYKNPFNWRVIHAANTNIVKDPHWIYPGQILIIPDVPAPEVGELPARPVETQPAPTPEAEVTEAPTEMAPAAPTEPEPKPEKWNPGLSREMPDGLAGGYPSMRRVKADKAWKEDGQITEFDGREIMAAQGDLVELKLPSGAKKGDTFDVYRKVAPNEEEDPKGSYMQTVGVVRVEEALSPKKYKATILKSGDSVQLGDLLKKRGT